MDKGFGKNTEVDVVVRPEDIDIVPADKARVSGKVVSVVFMGVHYEVDVDCGGYEWSFRPRTMSSAAKPSASPSHPTPSTS